MTADLVQNYLIYYQDRFNQALKSVGLNSNICDYNISTGIVPCSMPPLPSGHTKLSISRLLEITAPGTALDTVLGKFLVVFLRGTSREELCTINYAYAAYVACVMSSNDNSNRKFNIVQFAQQQLPLIYTGAHCNRLEQFTACWNILRETCGPKVRGLEQHATLLVEGCKMQSELDTVGCHWQDMLLPHYLQASRVTAWPIVFQCMRNPWSLEDTHYNKAMTMDDLDTVISLLRPGVEEVSRKCGSQPATRLASLLIKLRYLQRDTLNDIGLILN